MERVVRRERRKRRRSICHANRKRVLRDPEEERKPIWSRVCSALFVATFIFLMLVLVAATIYVTLEIMHNGWSDTSGFRASVNDDNVWYVDQATVRSPLRYADMADYGLRRPICYGEPFGENAFYASGSVYVYGDDGSVTKRDWSWHREYVGDVRVR